jgi:hypothetical protein
LLAIRSGYAQKRFRERAWAAFREYAPVRKEIMDRIKEADNLQREREYREILEQARLLQEEDRRRREQNLEETRTQRVWAYAILKGHGDDIVYVYRHDRPPVRPIPPDALLSEEGPLDATELNAALQRLHLQRSRRIVWDLEASAEVERRFRSQGVYLSFDDWWAAVTSGEWRTHKRISRRTYKELYVTTHHSAPGIRWPELAAVDALFSPDGVIGPDAVAGFAGGADGGDSGGSDGGADGGGADGGGGGADGGGGGGDGGGGGGD